MHTRPLSIVLAAALAAGTAVAQPATNSSDPTSQQVAARPGTASSPTRRARPPSKRASQPRQPAGDVTEQEISPHPGSASSPTRPSKKPRRVYQTTSPLTAPDDPDNANVQPRAGIASQPRR